MRKQLDLYRQALGAVCAPFRRYDDPDLNVFQSPIEEMLAVAIVVAGEESLFLGFQDGTDRLRAWYEQHAPSVIPWLDIGASRIAEGRWHVFFAQMPEGEYSIDLALCGTGLQLAIECDGHDFHERTKEQARHDKQRDRYLIAKGWTVIRFTGSEIWADPIRCAYQVIEIVLARATG